MAFGLDLGNLIVHLRADDVQFNRTLLNAENRLKRTADKFSRIGRSMTMYVTAPIVALGLAATKSFASFDDAMTQSLAIMKDATPAMREEMETLARDISKTSITSATNLAKSYFYLASAGFSAEQSIASLAAVERFAVAGRFDMALATDLATDAQSALGLTVKDAQKNLENMTRVTDVLTGANTLANATVQQFSESIVRAGPAMKAFGIEIEEGTAVLSAFADQGKKGAMAGELFSRMLRLMIKGFIDNRAAWDKFNISIEDADGSLRPMADIVRDLTRLLGNMGVIQKAATLQMLGFQARSQQAIMPLLGMGDLIEKYNEALIKMRGITKEIAEKQLKSFSSQMRIVWHNVKDVAIDIGGMLAPHIIRLNAHIKRATDFWHTLNDSVKQNILYYAGLAAVIGPLLMATGLLIKSLSLVIGTVRVLVGWLGGLAVAFASPLMIILALAATAYVLRAAWIQNLKAVKDVMKEFVDAAKYYYEYLANSIIGKFISWMVETFKQAFVDINKNWKHSIADIAGLYKGIMAWINGQWGEKGAFSKAYVEAYDVVLSKTTKFGKDVVKIFETIPVAVKTFSAASVVGFEELMDAVKTQFGKDADAIVALIEERMQRLQKIPISPHEQLRLTLGDPKRELGLIKEEIEAIKEGMDLVDSATEDVAKTTMTLADAYRAMRGEMGRMTEEVYKAQLEIIKGLYKEYEEAGVNTETLEQWYKEQVRVLEIEYLQATDNIWAGFKAAGMQIKYEIKTWGEKAHEFSMTFRDSITSGLESSLRDFKNWKDHLLDMFEEVYWSAVRIAFLQPFAGALAGGMTTALGNLFSGGMPTVGSVTPAAGATLTRYQHGGLVTEPQIAVVGDVPELITPLSQLKNITKREERMEININYTGRERHEVNVEESIGALKQQVLTITMDAMQHNPKYRKGIKQASR